MTSETFLDGRITLRCGDSRDVLKTIPDCSIDAIVCDPPYALTSTTKRWANTERTESTMPKVAVYARATQGFMGQKWDTGETAFDPTFWAECLRVLKPGGHVVAFSGTRTYHRMACAIEDAGFEVRDMLQYLYGSGFPKSHSVTKGLGDAVCCCEETSERYLRSVRGSDVSPPIHTEDQCGEVLLEGMPEQGPHGAVLCEDFQEGYAGLEESGMEGRGDLSQAARQLRQRSLRSMSSGIDIDGENGRLRHGTSAGDGAMGRVAFDADRMRSPSRPQAAKQPALKSGIVARQPQPQTGGAWEDCGRCGKPMVPAGWGTALKPACEPICFGRKPLTGTVASNVLEHGTGAINIDGCRVATDDVAAIGEPSWGGPMKRLSGAPGQEGKLVPRQPPNNQGRWPANIIHDGSEEVIAAFPDAPGQQQAARDDQRTQGGVYGAISKNGTKEHIPRGDSGSAARFYYTAKADADDRLGSKHPTVKPVDLMQWLCRLVTPKGGTVLDPFAGTGTTGEAAFREGFKAVLIEREEEYQADIRRRMALCMSGPDERARESIKAKTKDQPVDHGPLFAGAAE